MLLIAAPERALSMRWLAGMAWTIISILGVPFTGIFIVTIMWMVVPITFVLTVLRQAEGREDRTIIL